MVVVIIVLVLTALLLPAVQTSRLTPEGCRHWCVSRLQQLAEALRIYHGKYGSFPPAYVADKMGKPVHSWRVQMLPFLDARDAYEQYDFNEAWDSPKNSAVVLQRYSERRYGKAFFCPGDPSWRLVGQQQENNLTSYLAVIGQQTAWRGTMPTKLSDLPDGGRRMILLVESGDRAINWKEPKDLSYEEAMSGINRREVPCIFSTHAEGGDYFHHARRGAYVAFVDGSVHFLPEDISPDDLRALLTGDLTRDMDLDSLARPSLNWSHIVALIVLIASGGVLIVGSLVQRLRRTTRTKTAETTDEHGSTQIEAGQ